MPLFGRKSKDQPQMKDDFDTNQQQMNPSDMSTDTAMHSGQQNQFSGMPQQSGMMSGPQSGMPGSYNQPTQPQGGGLVGGQQAQHQQQHHRGAAGGSLSSALKEQGMMKEREAEALHSQSKELAEAERLEQAAKEHRDRATSGGADPANRAQGGNTGGGY